MRNKFLTILIGTGLILQQHVSAQSYSLETCYAQALKKSYVIANQIEKIDQAEAHLNSSKAISLPTLSFDNVLSYQDTPNSNQAESFFPSNQTTSKIQFSIPIFKGFRDIALVKQKSFQKESYKFGLENAKRTLNLNVSEVYYLILSLKAQDSLYTKEIQAYEKHKKELQYLKRLARAREIDIITIDSTISSLETAQEIIRGQIKTSYAGLNFLTDLPTPFELELPILPTLNTDSISELTKNISTLPSIKEQINDVKANEENYKISKNYSYPSAYFNSNYYLIRPGIFSDTNWDIGVNISIPLFSKANNTPKIALAASQLSVAKNKEKEIIENEIYAIQSTYIQFKSTQEQFKKLEKSFQVANTRYQLLAIDFKQGLASNNDILQGLAALYQTQRQKDYTEIMLQSLQKKLIILSQKSE